jgi:hypothetical protein
VSLLDFAWGTGGDSTTKDDLTALAARTRVLADIARGAERAEAKHGHARHIPAGTGRPGDYAASVAARQRCERAYAAGTLTWRHIVDEEYAEACAETNPARLRAELIDTQSAITCWIEDLDRETGSDGAAPRPDREDTSPVRDAADTESAQTGVPVSHAHRLRHAAGETLVETIALTGCTLALLGLWHVGTWLV